jgi:hypothetical protein
MIAIALYWRIAMRRGIFGGIFIKADIAISLRIFFPRKIKINKFFGKITNDALDNLLLRINLPNATENFHKFTISFFINKIFREYFERGSTTFLFLYYMRLFGYSTQQSYYVSSHKQAEREKNLVIMIEICMVVKEG